MNDRRKQDGTARDGRPAVSRIELSPCSRSPATATAETLRDERLGRVSVDQPTGECAPLVARAGGAGIAPERAGSIRCGLCTGELLVVVSHTPACLKSQWFDGRLAWDCVEACTRANCPACHPAAVGEGSDGR
jgi:hypothetical protein